MNTCEGGFFGVGAMKAYIDLQTARLKGQHIPSLPLTPQTNDGLEVADCQIWSSSGSLLALSSLHGAPISDALWGRFTRSIGHARPGDFYAGAAGAIPVLGLVGPFRPDARDTLLLLQRSVEGELARLLHRAERGESVAIGFGHGLAGCLVSFEMARALIGSHETGLRHRTIQILKSSAIATPDGPVWQTNSDDRSLLLKTHGVCTGGPGICLAAILGLRYSEDTAYEDLLSVALETVPLQGGDHSFCCGVAGRAEVLIELYRTTEDESYLVAARQLLNGLAVTDPTDETWKTGALGPTFARVRLEHPHEIDLPGLPMSLQPW